jgi:hypothetical protein
MHDRPTTLLHELEPHDQQRILLGRSALTIPLPLLARADEVIE